MSCVKLDRNDGMTSSNDAYENKSMSIAILGRDSNSIFHTDFRWTSVGSYVCCVAEK